MVLVYPNIFLVHFTMLTTNHGPWFLILFILNLWIKRECSPHMLKNDMSRNPVSKKPPNKWFEFNRQAFGKPQTSHQPSHSNSIILHGTPSVGEHTEAMLGKNWRLVTDELREFENIKRLRLETSAGELAIVVEESIECTSNEWKAWKTKRCQHVTGWI